MSTRTMLAGLAAIATIAAAPVAQADVIYTYAGAFVAPQGSVFNSFNMVLDLADEEVASGGFWLSGTCHGYGACAHYGPPTYSGDVNGYTSITIEGVLVDAPHLYDRIELSISFDGAGDIS